MRRLAADLWDLSCIAVPLVAIVGVPMPARAPFAEAIGLPDLWSDPRFAPPLITVEHKKQLLAELAQTSEKVTPRALAAILDAYFSVGAPYPLPDEEVLVD